MKYPRFSHHLIALSLSVIIITTSAQSQQTAPQKYIIKPLNLGTNTEIRARSTRNLQVRVTDENDRPVPDAPVLFLLSNGGVSGGSTGSFAGQTSLRAMTNAEGIAQVEYTAGDVVGSKTNFKVQVEGTEAVWEGVLFIISALVEGSESKSASPPASQPEPQSTSPSASQVSLPPTVQFTVQAATQPEPKPEPQPVTQPIPAPNPIQLFNSPIIGHSPNPSVVRQTFTTTDGRKLTLQSMQGKVVVMHFFGVWCDTSKKQIQSIRSILARYSSEELEVIGMSVKDPRSTPDSLRQFVIDLQITYAVVADVEDKRFAKFIDSKNVSVPQTLIYGRDGRVIGHYLGFNPQVGAEIERIIKSEIVKQ